MQNSYLIQVNVTNHHKKRFFYDDLPEVLNVMVPTPPSITLLMMLSPSKT